MSLIVYAYIETSSKTIQLQLFLNKTADGEHNRGSKASNGILVRGINIGLNRVFAL